MTIERGGEGEGVSRRERERRRERGSSNSESEKEMIKAVLQPKIDVHCLVEFAGLGKVYLSVNQDLF